MPSLFFETERLYVRPLQPGDYQRARETAEASDLSSEEREGSLIAVSQTNFNSFVRMIQFREREREADRLYISGIFERATEKFVGDVLLCEFQSLPELSAHCGLVVSSPFRRRGFGTEVMRGLVRYSLQELGFRKITGRIRIGNDRSLRMCLAAGFLLEEKPRICKDYGVDQAMWIICASEQSFLDDNRYL